MQEQANNPSQQKRVFRLIVGSAGEAVAIIQKKFGPGATVQSVKQYKPKGVTKLWSSPKLEIIVSVPANPQVQEKFSIEEPVKEENPSVSAEEAMPEIEDVTSKQPAPQSIPDEEPTKEVSPVQESENFVHSNLSIEDVLIQSQFDPTIVQRLKMLPQWQQISQRGIKQGLTEIITLLREEFTEAQNLEISPFAAFIGTPGVGKSTILRKYVANRVFVHGKNVQILKLDDEDPNPDDMLNLFCEVIGVNLVRDPNDLELKKDTELYIDLPGVSKNNPDKIRHFKGILDDLEIKSRILVMNALYDSHSLSNTYDLARKYGATHQAFTHLDELEVWSKLWKFVLKGSLPLIFLNMGDEISAAAKEEFLPLLVSKTFPKILQN